MIHVAVNLGHKNKMPLMRDPDEIRTWWNWFNGGFANLNLPTDEFIEHIQAGHAYCAQHHRYRKRSEFYRTNIICLDYDTEDERSSFVHLVQDDFIASYASFLYTTPSHTEQAPKARVVFRLDDTIYNADEYEKLTKAVVWRFPDSDQKVKDATRLFFGSENCHIRHLGKVLPVAVIQNDILPEYEKAQEQKRRYFIETEDIVEDVPPQTVNRLLESLMDHILHAPDGEKHDTLNRIAYTVGGYIAGGYLGEGRAEQELFNAIKRRGNLNSEAAALDTIRNALQDGQRHPLYISWRGDGRTVAYEEEKVELPKHIITLGQGKQKTPFEKAMIKALVI